MIQGRIYWGGGRTRTPFGCAGIGMTTEPHLISAMRWIQLRVAVPRDRASLIFFSTASLSADGDTTEPHSARKQGRNSEMINPTRQVRFVLVCSVAYHFFPSKMYY